MLLHHSILLIIVQVQLLLCPVSSRHQWRGLVDGQGRPPRNAVATYLRLLLGRCTAHLYPGILHPLHAHDGAETPYHARKRQSQQLKDSSMSKTIRMR